MFSHTTKRILPALLVFGFIMITTPIRHYESFAGQSPDEYKHNTSVTENRLTEILQHITSGTE